MNLAALAATGWQSVYGYTVVGGGGGGSPPPADYFVDASRPDDSGNGLTAGTAKKYINSGIALMAGQSGKILEIVSGTYSNANDAITASSGNGAAGVYNTVRAATDGGVVITQPISITGNSNRYMVFQGLKFDYAGEKTVQGKYMKFQRCAFKGGAATGNVVNVAIGTNDFTPGAQYVLFEDCWAYGSGGRYSFIVYNADRIVMRRCVVRHDGGWSDGGSSNPEAGLTVYNSSNVDVQNCLVLDSDGTFSTWQGAFYCNKNSSSSTASDTNRWVGCISLKNNPSGFNDAASFRFDGQGPHLAQTIIDCVGFDTPWGINLNYGGQTDATINRVTLGQTTRAGTGYGMGSGSTGTKSITNAIIFNHNTDDLDGLSATYFDTYNNGATSTGTGQRTIDPLTNGLLYLGRIESASNLKTAGSSGGQMGAQIVNKIGADGTLWGDTGWNTDTGNPLWPFPNEARIRTDMQEGGVTRGFCASGKTLTSYIWGYLGNASPY